MHLDIFLEQ